MKKAVLFLIFLSVIYAGQRAFAMPNPWTDCKDDINCGAKITGFNFPVNIKNYNVRATKDIMEISFPLDKKRVAHLRKSQSSKGNIDKNGIADISGVYNNYPVNKTITLKNGVPFNVKGDNKKYYVVNFSAESGYYSIYCKEGMKLKDIKYFYKLLEEAEATRYNYDDTKEYTIEQLQDLRRVDDIVEPVYTQDCFPKTLEKKGVTYNCFERANLGQDVFCSASEIKMIKEYYKKGQDKDPLNDGSGKFCAKEE